MRELAGHGQEFDAVAICCDSLNYLKSEKDVFNTFKNVFSLLKEGGLLLFDVHSVYKMDVIFPGSTYADQDEEVSVIWQSYAGEEPHSAVHDLTFFVQNRDVYERFDESHEQRTFQTEKYISLLRQAGFEVQCITADFSKLEPIATSKRICCQLSARVSRQWQLLRSRRHCLRVGSRRGHGLVRRSFQRRAPLASIFQFVGLRGNLKYGNRTDRIMIWSARIFAGA